MITILHIKNIGIIEEITVELEAGFNVITGETGAGKSLIIDSLDIISGGRFSKDMIRKGEKHSFVEICLYLPGHPEASEDGNVIVSREIYSTGKNSCRINGRLITVAKLRSFMKRIMDIHGQHDNQSLFEVSEHIRFLDAFAGKELQAKKQEYLIHFTNYQRIVSELKKKDEDERQRQRKLDLLRYQYQEIDTANLIDEEDVALEQERKIMLNYESMNKNLALSCESMEQHIVPGLEQTRKALEKLEAVDSCYQEKQQAIQNMYYEIQEIARELEEARDLMEYDSYRANEIENRLMVIQDLKRKYGNHIAEILAYQDTLKTQICEIENWENCCIEWEKEKQKVQQEMKALACTIHALRMKNASILEEQIQKELIALDMRQASFRIGIQWDAKEQYHANGLDQVEFLIQTNVGDGLQPLAKIASGGEISRIMLAIKTVISNLDTVPIMVFDEIDTGISGSAAKAVRNKIKKIASTHQIITVTHLPIITASATTHIKVHKIVENGVTKTKAVLLQEDEILKEIAWISTGEITATALQHALELKRMP